MLPSINAPDRQAEAFPVLTPAQIARIRPHANVRSVQVGEVLFEPGKLGMSCFVVISGKLEIAMPGLSGEQVFVTYGPGQFSGEVVLISGARALARGRVAEPGDFLELSADALRTLIAKDAELSEILMRAFLLRRVALISEGLGNVVVLGSQHSSNTLRLREFLTRNGHPHRYVDLDSDRASQELLDRFEIKLEDIPVVICSGKTVLRNPTNQRLAECLGFAGHIDEHRVYDVAIVGAGPAGLAAAVYAASEGLDAVVIESEFPGGQAGASSKIENYVGFPMGISGQELAGRAVVQAEKFGAQMTVGQKVVKVKCDQQPYELTLENGGLIETRSIVIASGAQYNKPNVENLERFEGQGIYYAATFMEAQLCTGEEIIVVGGGNSAGQAAAFLAETVQKVYMLVRGKELSETMSRYLIQRIVENPAIELHLQTEIVAVGGDSHLERVTWLNRATGEESVHDIRHVFVMAGASPRTDWLRGCVVLDQQGFILTGRDFGRGPGHRTSEMAAQSATADAGNQCACSFCCRRYSFRQREARCLCLPCEIAWQGKVVRTAIWKRPVSERVFARRLNLDGDGQADLKGHGGEYRAVMVYQLEAYRYWEREFGRNDFEYGQFGENFTVEGLPDDEVCIGDRYRIGTAVFEVSQPRVTCYRLGIRMDNPQMATLLVLHHRPGFYCRVITEGKVGAGDEIQKIADGPDKISVAETDSLLYTANHDLSRIAIAAHIPALSPGWKSSFDSFLQADKNGIHNGNPGLTPSISPAPSWNGFRWARVVEVHRETHEVASIVLADIEGSPLPPALPGQFLALRCQPDKNSPPVVRSYSISGASDSGTYRISVKRGTGPGSQHLVDATQVGDRMEISAPHGEFILRAGRRPVVLLSAGIGITPVLSMLHALASGGTESPREVWWIYAAPNATEQVFAQKARQLLAAIPGSHSAMAYSNPDPTDRPGNDFDVRGRWDLASLEKLAIPVEADFYVCGPPAFLRDMSRDLISLGAPQDAIHHEVFGPEDSIEPGVTKAEVKPPHSPVPLGSGPIVSFTRSGSAVPWDTRFKSILELAEACDVPVRWSCRIGVCHTCECGILDGRVGYAPEPLDPPALGNVLICCSTPESPIQLDL